MPGDLDSVTEIRHLDVRFDPARRIVFGREVPVHLTPSEFRVLTALLSAPGRICSRQRLIALAIADGAVVQERTIDVHIAALRRKLGAPDVIETVRRQGYRVRTS